MTNETSDVKGIVFTLKKNCYEATFPKVYMALEKKKVLRYFCSGPSFVGHIENYKKLIFIYFYLAIT